MSTTLPTEGTSAPSSNPAFLRRFLRKPLGVASACYLVVISVLCALAPLISPYGPLQQDLFNTATGPSGAHWLGTDALGRDILSRLLYGGQITLLGVAVTIVTIVVVSVPVGLAAGYLGGRTDRWVNNVTDLLLSIPNIVIVLAVTAIFFENLYAAMITFGLLGSAGVIRVIRSTVLAVREELYVAAARTAGVTDGRIILRHVLPRVAGPIIVQASLWGGIALGVETGLSFLGVGVAAPAPSWGGAIYDASQLVYQDAFMLVPTGGIVFLTILAFSFLGDAVRDATFEGWSAASRPVGRRRRRRRLVTELTSEVLDESSNEPPAPDGDTLLDVSHLSVVFSSGERDITLVE
ncbi:MAG: ABC transporter permease, partial [Acidobacteria bacterium]|nr:ABC transporter permease [Acidobacteriota bacterium]